MSVESESAAPRPATRHGVRVGVRAFFASLSLLVILGSGLAWATFQKFTADVPHGAAVPVDAADPDGAAQDILLIGNDTRAGATPAELRALHAGRDQSTANADTMMVLHVPANGTRPTLVSFPRDSWVAVPGHGMGKLNSAYPLAYSAARDAHRSELAAQSAGILATIRTIHALTGLHIDHYVQVNLLGFYRISEAIGGVTVCLNAAQNASTETGDGMSGESGINLPKGVSVIEGAQALAFVRQRHGLPHGDLDRIRRQQYFLKSAFAKVTSGGTLLNPFKMHDLLSAVGRSLLVDPSLDLLGLARQMQSLTSGNINVATIPNNGPQLIHPDGVATAIVAVDTRAIPAFIQQLDGGNDRALANAKPARPATVTVDVLNGTATARLAARNATVLRADGFHVDAVDSAPGTANTTVEYPPGHEAQARAVLAVVPHARALATTQISRVTLVLGADGVVVQGVRPAAPAAGSLPRARSAPPAAPAAAPPAAPTGGCID